MAKLKTCTRCEEEKNISSFYRDKGRKDGHFPWCKPCSNDHVEEWRDLNRGRLNEINRLSKAKNAEANRARRLMKKYGITLEEYNQILDEQGGTCAICKTAFSAARALAVDHDHNSSGKESIRGLLCRGCNFKGLGWVEKVGWESVHDYLTSPPARKVLGGYATTKQGSYCRRGEG